MTKIACNRIILSTDDNDMYRSFWPIVAKAWKKLFDVKVSLAYVTNSPKPELLKKMREYGDVFVYTPVKDVPVGNQAKMARFFLAAEEYPDEVCMVNDIDTAPLNRDYFIRVLEDRRADHLLAVGAELYVGTPHEGKFPIGEITAEGDVFKRIVNPKGLDFDKYINSFKKISEYDHKEDISVPSSVFSDESLLRVLISRSNVPVIHTPRNVNIAEDWIDRSWWRVDEVKLQSGGYVLVNFLRPLKNYFNEIYPVISYIYEDEEYTDIFA